MRSEKEKVEAKAEKTKIQLEIGNCESAIEHLMDCNSVVILLSFSGHSIVTR